MKKTVISLLMLAAFSQVAVAGNYDISATGNTRNATLREGKVQEAEVKSVRNVDIEPTKTAQVTGTGAGVATGAVLGGALSKKNRAVGSILGGVLGGVVGNVATDKITSKTAQEIILKKADGKLSVITQADSNLVVGQKVYIVESAGKLRVIPQEEPSTVSENVVSGGEVSNQ